MIEVEENEYEAYFVRAQFSRGEHAGKEVLIYYDLQKLSILQQGIVQLDGDELREAGITLAPVEMPYDELRGIGPETFEKGTDDPAILNAALEMWDACNSPGSSRIDWYTGEPL